MFTHKSVLFITFDQIQFFNESEYSQKYCLFNADCFLTDSTPCVKMSIVVERMEVIDALLQWDFIADSGSLVQRLEFTGQLAFKIILVFARIHCFTRSQWVYRLVDFAQIKMFIGEDALCRSISVPYGWTASPYYSLGSTEAKPHKQPPVSQTQCSELK